MMRALVPLIAASLLVPLSVLCAQTPAPNIPGFPPGAQRPGLPTRDTAQKPQTGTARVRGRVVAAVGSTPLRRAQVILTGVDNPQFRRLTTADGDGRYEITDLPAGRYQLSVNKTGYVTLQHGQRRPFEPGMPISLRDAETMALDFALPRGGVIAVRLSDEFGEPVSGAFVQAQRFQWGNDGQRRLAAVPSGGPGGLTATDDRGEMRLFGLMPGDYVVEARPGLGSQGVSAGGDTSEGFARTFYPGTLSEAQAQPITVGVGQEVNIQLTMSSSRLARIRGTAVDSQGRPAAGAGVSVYTVTAGGSSSSSAGQVAADGTFSLSGVAPGEHSLRFNLRNGTETESAAMPIVVTGDMSGVSAILSPGTTISGRLVFETPPPPPGQGWPPLLRINASDQRRQLALLNNSTGGDVDPDGNFRINNAEGRVFFSVQQLPATWMIKSVMLEGQDITDTPLELGGRRNVSDVRVTLTNRITHVSGFVTDGKGQNLSDYVVVIQPAEQKDPGDAARLVRALRPDTNGRFEARGLRPGRYVATAIESMEQNRHYSPEFQKELRRGAREFTLQEGETRALDLRLTEGL